MPDDDRKIALAVAGGGYRATLYSLGSLWRLNDFGLLPELSMITSVSGGSILTAYLALHWNDLEFDALGRAVDFREVIAEPLQQFCSESIDVKSVLSGLFSFRNTIGDKIALAYDQALFKGAHINAIPENAPEFIFYGTNYQTGSSLRVQKKEIFDYKIGSYPDPDISLAKAAAVSSAFPPLLSPVTLHTDSSHWNRIKDDGFSEYFDYVELREKLLLADGGLYDNLGLEAVWKGGYSHVLSCDAGAPFKVNHKVAFNWLSQMVRMSTLMGDQQRALRKRILIDRFKTKQYGGTYFGISTHIGDYDVSDAMTSDTPVTAGLQKLRTRLNRFSPEDQGRLINWGYALADSALRKWSPEILKTELNTQGQWPLPDFPLQDPDELPAS